MLKDVVVDGVVLGSIDVPEGYELVAWRSPKLQEEYLRLDGTRAVAKCEFSLHEQRWIVCKKFVWPDWVKPGTWYARDEDGWEILYTHKPSREGNCWGSSEGTRIHLESRLLLFPQTPVCSWKDSLMQKPLEAK